MIVETYDPRRRVAGNGVTTVFAAPAVISEGQLEVKLYEIATGEIETLVLNTDYTVSNANEFVSDDDSTREDSVVTLTTPHEATHELIIDRIPEDSQETAYPEGGGFPAKSHEAALDKQAMAIQALRLLFRRALLLPDGEETIDFGLPADRATKVIGFDVTGALALVQSAVGMTGEKGDTGDTGPTGAIENAPDTGLRFVNELTSAIYRAGAGDMRAKILGADILQLLASGANITGQLDVSGMILGGGMAFDIGTPANLTANQDNYALPANVGVVRFNPTANRTISGFVAPTVARRIVVTNISAFTLEFLHETTSTAANRFSLGTNFTLPAACSVEFYYDLTTARWRILETNNIATAAEVWAGTASRELITPAIWKAAQALQNQGTIASGATFNFDGSLGFNQYITVGTGNFTLGAPLNLLPGQAYWLRIYQHATTPRTWGTPAAGWQWPGGVDQALTATAAKVDDLFFQAITSSTATANLSKNVA